MTGKTRTVLPQGALVEFIPQGGYVKVSAVDPVTKVEVSIVGDASAPHGRLRELAVQKLKRILLKLQLNGDMPGRGGQRQDPPSGWDL